jgi:hypothetical protein
VTAGLQIFGPDGRVVLDTSSRTGRVVGIVYIAGANGSLTNAGLGIPGASPFVSFSPQEIFGTVGGQIISPTFSFSGTTMSWTYPTPGAGLGAPQIKSGWAIYGIW